MMDNENSVLGNGIRLGRLQVRLAQDEAEVRAAQELRYRIFYTEMGAKADKQTALEQRDRDSLDAYCDHLIVLDHKAENKAEAVVGTYRMVRREAAKRNGNFYSASEYDISLLEAFPGEILEIGRSCVAVPFRNMPTMQLLWRGISDYVASYGVQILFGTACLPGTDLKKLAIPLSYLYHYHLAAPYLRTKALPSRYVDMRMIDASKLDPEGGLKLLAPLSYLPPLIKGYLRVGGFVGDGAVVDEQFNTTDVCVIVKTDMIAEKYARHYDFKTNDANT